MSKTVRIRTTPNGKDSYLKVKVEQDFDFLEILSLKISQEEAYARFCSDYGVVVGRVIVNNGFGIPNAKVSIFVPISNEDKEDSELFGLYPFENIDDKDDEGIRYNLLPRKSKPSDACFTPVGTFPTKREIIDNDGALEVYDKYYKFTTTTNEAGDFMLFGVPTGSHTINVDVDLSDIGIASQRPYDYIAQGEDKKRFESPTKFKSDKDLDKLMQVKSFKKGVNVQPFWGDTEQCDIGISRVDVDVKKRIIPSAIFIGSLFSDTEKNSINKNCRPRKDLGRLSETETGEGTVEMIRRTIDGKIERFDIEGGRVMDEFGTWAYQVPMNLDYKVTDEFGNLVPSEDPNRGIPTRANVRFRISKDVTGDEGRLRTTAKYLVPHNPANSSQIDYNFDENTGSEHFRNFYWNKIYTVSNFIPRVQSVCLGDKCSDNRNITGIKDVDEDTGLKTPFPYNRVDTDINPLFTIICSLLSIIIFILFIINSTLITILNTIISVLNTILSAVCQAIFAIGKLTCYLSNLTNTSERAKCRKKACIGKCSLPCNDCDCKSIINYIPCITMECDDKIWAPGCDCSDPNALNSPVGSNDPTSVSLPSRGCWAAATNSNSPKDILHWSGLLFKNDNCGHDGHDTVGAGLADCYSIKLAEALNMFEFDFYNDWVNGTLYAYLLKYKKRKNGKDKFCDTDCDSSSSDNRCNKSYFVDTCKTNSDGRVDNKEVTKKVINEGYLKLTSKRLPNGQEVETMYYSPYSKDANAKLFATELIHLGSIFDCDWQGIPKLQPYLVPTTYKRPPYTAEYLDDNTTRIACGMVATGNAKSDGLFFSINCVGLNVGQIEIGNFTPSRCDNLKRVCEFGIDIDESNLDSNNNVIVGQKSDCYINGKELTQPWGGLVRNSFAQLNFNDGPSKLDSWPLTGLPPTFDTGLGNGQSNHKPEYLEFRDKNEPLSNSYNTSTNLSVNNYRQPDNSFYFYFGTEPNRTALENMNRKYFTECEVIETNDFIISGIITDASSPNGCDGEIATTVAGGEAPYTYVWSGPNGYTNTETIGDIIGLCSGNYTVTVTDSNGGTSTTTFTVNSPSPLNCNITTNPAISAGGSGEIMMDVFGGTPPYVYTINNGAPVSFTGSYNVIQQPAGTYVVTIIDQNGDSCTNPSTGVTITQPPALNIGGSINFTHTTCGEDNGSITLEPLGQLNIGGVPPYSFLITGPNNYSTPLTNISDLEAGTYTVTVTDGNQVPQTDSQTVIINPSISPTISYVPDWYCWVDPNSSPTINAVFNGITANGAFTIEATPIDSNNNPTTPIITQSFNSGTNTATIYGLQDMEYVFVIKDSNNCSESISVDFTGRVPTSPLNATAEQNDTCDCSSILPTNGQVTATAAGGYGGYTYLWFKDGLSTGITTPSVTVQPTLCGSVWKCRIRDTRGCEKYTNDITIT